MIDEIVDLPGTYVGEQLCNCAHIINNKADADAIIPNHQCTNDLQ